VKEDVAYWTSFMENFETAHGTPIATITHVSDMSKLMDVVRTSSHVVISTTSPCHTTDNIPFLPPMQDAPMCDDIGTVSIRKYVKLPKADTYTHGKHISFLEEEAVEEVQLCRGQFLVHTKWTSKAIETLGKSDDEFTMRMPADPAAVRLAAPAVVYKVAPAKFRGLEAPLMAKVAPEFKLPPLYESAKEAGISWAEKASSISSSSSSGSVPVPVPKPGSMVHPAPPLLKAQSGGFRARDMSDSDMGAALDHRVNIATAAEAAIARAHERHRLRAARHSTLVLAAAEEEGITADDDAVTVATYAALLETAARAGAAASVINRPWGYYSGLDPYYDGPAMMVDGFLQYPRRLRANCLAYATFSYLGEGLPSLRYCHPGRASNGPGKGLPAGWSAVWALPHEQRAAMDGIISNDYDISSYLPPAQGGVLAGAMGGDAAAGLCATMQTYLQAGKPGDAAGDWYAGDALLNRGPAVASLDDYHAVYATFHRYVSVESYKSSRSSSKWRISIIPL